MSKIYNKTKKCRTIKKNSYLKKRLLKKKTNKKLLFKTIGGTTTPISITPNKNERKGVIDIAGESIGNLLENIYKKTRDISLKLLGLQLIKNNEIINIDTSGISLDSSILEKGKNISSIADKSVSQSLDNINNYLKSSIVESNTKRTAEETAIILKNLLKLFNDTLDNPELKEELKEALQNAGEVGIIFVKAMEEPFDEFISIVSKSIEKSSSAIGSGAIKIGTDMMAAVPGVGSIIEIGKILNDSSKAASSVVEANGEIIEGMSDFIIKTKENFEKVLKEYEEKKNNTIENINSSINEFNNTNKLGENKLGENKLGENKLGGNNNNIQTEKLSPILKINKSNFKTPKTLKKVRFNLL
jgi:hypothetical protein